VLRGCRINEARMRALGCPTYRYKLAAFVLAGAVAGLAGALSANLTEFVSPDSLHWTRSGDLLVMVILGGMGTLFGPVVGAMVFLLLEEFLPILFREAGLPLLQEHWRVVFGPLLILIVLFARQGIYGTLIARSRTP
jgi:branched-chain amino acid transport system permease protein